MPSEWARNGRVLAGTGARLSPPWRHHSLPKDTCIKHVITAWKEKNCWEKEVAISDTDSRLLRELKPTEQKELLCNKCCRRISSLGLRMEMSQIVTGVAWRPFQSTFWLRSQGSLWDPASQDGKFCLSFGGPIRRAHFLSRPSSAPPAASDPRHSCWEAIAHVAGFSLWALQEGPGCWPALAAIPPGEAAGSNSPAPEWPAFISMPQGPSEGHHCPPNPCFVAPSGRTCCKSQPRPVWPTSITVTCRLPEGHGFSLRLCSVAPLRCGCRWHQNTRVNFPLVAKSGSHQTDFFLVPESLPKRRMRFTWHHRQVSLLVLEEMSLGWICYSGTESTPDMAKAPRSPKDGQLLPRTSWDHPIDQVRSSPAADG